MKAISIIAVATQVNVKRKCAQYVEMLSIAVTESELEPSKKPTELYQIWFTENYAKYHKTAKKQVSR